MRSAVLLLVFNRPAFTRRVFEAIRAARPPRLYVSADGPRRDRAGERDLCEEVRRIVTDVDWPCDLRTQFLPENLGCKHGEATGMDWFFRNEAEGIILEDDTLPISGFFRYCDELLDVYRDDECVFSVAGNGYVNGRFEVPESYLFTLYADYWGWAGWRRSWRFYDVAMADWPAWRDSGGLERVSGGNAAFEKYWRRIFDDTHAGKIDTWDYQFLFQMWRHGGVSIIASNNMVTNLGYGPGATHTTGPAPRWLSRATTSEPTFPLVHPPQVKTRPDVDAYWSRTIYGISKLGELKRFIGRFQLARDIRDWIGSRGIRTT